ncbi:hypothetical protein M405DRAFT_44522 [Rhizopogon salebrosus TDB-379]|nr:hypothetical protein M405DRAFT_44522 [Rhizopogon salebrosus TDB-379]
MTTFSTHIPKFWNWVGQCYSLWSATSLPTALYMTMIPSSNSSRILMVWTSVSLRPLSTCPSRN